MLIFDLKAGHDYFKHFKNRTVNFLSPDVG